MPQRVAVIGAGIAGITCARRLSDAGAEVVMFDKGRTLGGRLASRISDGLSFDHGAPHVHVSNMAFSQLIDQLESAGSAARLEGGTFATGVPSMNTLLDPLTVGLDVKQSAEVTALVEGDRGWTIGLANREPETGFDAVAVAIPAEQAARLVEPLGLGWHDDLAHITYAPVMTMMAAFDRHLPIETGVQLASGFDLAAQIRNSTKPSRPTETDQWVVHADTAWSRANLNTDKDTIASALLERFMQANGIAPAQPIYLRGHRWRFARVERALGRSHLLDPTRRIGLAGDWCRGPNAENAFESGLMLAEAMLSERG